MKVDTIRVNLDNSYLCKLMFTPKINSEGNIIYPTPEKPYLDISLIFVCEDYVLYRFNPAKHPGDCEYPKVFEYELIKKEAKYDEINPTTKLPRTLFSKPGKT